MKYVCLAEDDWWMKMVVQSCVKSETDGEKMGGWGGLPGKP